VSESPKSVRRRDFLAGVGAAAVSIPALSGTSAPAAGATPRGPSPFPPFPDASITATQDRQQMLWQLGLTQPILGPITSDPNVPKNAFPVDPNNPEGQWTDPLGHFVVRSNWGYWTTYDDSAGPAGGSASRFGDFGPFSNPRYTDIDLLTMQDGTPVRTPEDWWTKRRPELLRLVQENLHGRIPDRSLWPEITWSTGPVTTGTANGFDYRQVVVTGNIDISSYPQIRNLPVIQGTLRTPLDKQGQPVPVMVAYDSVDNVWQFTAPSGYGVFGYSPTLLQPDSGGANMSSYIIGLINKGNWRKPDDWGALAAWGWGVSRLIDFFETRPEVDATRISVQGHSRFGKAALVTAAYDERIVTAFPSAAGQCGTSWIRRAWGESLENVAGGDSEYHWVAGNAMKFLGELNPGQYWPRKVEDMPVDSHCVLALVAPRAVMEACGTDTPPGFGDAWTDPRGMFLSGKVASDVWTFLGWPGQIIPDGTVFTSGPGESIGGTPPIDQYFLDGTVAWGRHHQGHTPAPDWPAFVTFSSRYLDNSRPVVTRGQRFTLGSSTVVGTVQATDADNDPLGNWQITGGSGVGKFAIDRDTGEITVTDPQALERANASRFTLAVIVSDGRLAADQVVVEIEVPRRG
jgi:hypothetical protein